MSVSAPAARPFAGFVSVSSLNTVWEDRTMTDSDEIFARVTRVVVQSLGVDEGDVAPSATLRGDLGAESIDFLDIVFRLEREFRLRIPRGELFPESLSPDDPAYTRD